MPCFEFQKDVGLKKTAAVKGAEENEKQYPNCKIINPKPKTKSGIPTVHNVGKEFKIFEENSVEHLTSSACKDKFIIKDENKGRVLKDKLVDHEKPSSSKEIYIPACITTLHREPAVSSFYSVPSIDDVDDIIQVKIHLPFVN